MTLIPNCILYYAGGINNWIIINIRIGDMMIIIKYEGNKIIHDEEKDLVLYIINDTHLKSSENEKYNFKILKRDNNYYCCVSDEYKSYQFNNVKYDKMIELNLSKHNKLVLDGIEIYININEEKFLDYVDTSLPFEIPQYCTYPMFTAIQGILKGHNNELNWVYNNYIQLWADKTIVSEYYWTDFKFANEEIREEFCPLIFKKYGEKITDNFVETIKNNINNKNYLFISIDMFDIDAWWQTGDERWHSVHQILIYGYNDIDREFLTADFYTGTYKKIKLSYEKVENGYMKYFRQHEEEKIGLFLDDLYFRYTPCEYNIDLNVMANLIKDFLDAKDTVYFNYLNICKVNMIIYGIDVIDCVKSYVHDVYQKKQYLDIRPIHFFMIINEIMRERMKYLSSNGYVDYTEEVEQLIEECYKLSVTIRNLGLKYNILYQSGAEVSVGNLESKITKFKELEKKMMIQCYRIIKGEDYNDTHIKQKSGIVQDDRLLDAKQLLLETDADEIYEDLKRKTVEKKIYSYKERDVFIFPFITQMFWRGDLGEQVDNTCDEDTEIVYYFDENDKMIAHYNLSNEFYNNTVKTFMIYKYLERRVERYIICIDKETDSRKLVAVDLFEIEDNKIIDFVRASSTTRNVIAKYKYQGNVIKSGVCKELLGEYVYSEYEDLFFFENENSLKQIIRKYDSSEELTIFPRYGFKELDYYYFANQLYTELCNVWDAKKLFLSYLLIDIIPVESKLNILFKWNNNEIKDLNKIFMKDYRKESYYGQKLTAVIIEIINKFIATKIVNKRNDEWKVEIRCDGITKKMYDGINQPELLLDF